MIKEKNTKATTIQSLSIHKGQVIQLGLETIALPNQQVIELEIVRHPGGAGALALNDSNQVCLIYQYRHAVQGWLWEIPAGKIEQSDKLPWHTAQRELREEAGVQATYWDSLGTLWSSPGFCNEKLYLYLVQKLEISTHQPDPNECLEVHWIDFPQALQWVKDDTICDAKTVAALLRAKEFLSVLGHRRC